MNFFRRTTRLAAAVVAALLWAVPALPQEAYQTNEKRIATLKPAEQAYERFRFWSTQIPLEQRTGEPWALYVKYLQEKGFSAPDAAAQIELVQQQGSRAEIE